MLRSHERFSRMIWNCKLLTIWTCRQQACNPPPPPNSMRVSAYSMILTLFVLVLLFYCAHQALRVRDSIADAALCALFGRTPGTPDGCLRPPRPPFPPRWCGGYDAS